METKYGRVVMNEECHNQIILFIYVIILAFFIHSFWTNDSGHHGLMVRRCFPVAKIVGSSPTGVAFLNCFMPLFLAEAMLIRVDSSVAVTWASHPCSQALFLHIYLYSLVTVNNTPCTVLSMSVSRHIRCMVKTPWVTRHMLHLYRLNS
jgi:hypothetical protein